MRVAAAPARAALSCLAALAIAGSSMPAAEAQQRIGFIRDAELENLMRDYANPILRAAGLGDSNVRVYIVNSTQFNAFVMDGRRIFINAGVIMQADTPNEVIGVLAHETGHIAGGHLARLPMEVRTATAIAVLTTVLGAGAIAAGAMAGAQGGIDAGQAVMMGGQQAAQRSLLSYQRSEEQAADRAAVNYLNATGQSARGMLRTFQRFADQTMFTGRHVDPYAQSHPMPRDRIAALETLARQSPHFERPDPPALQARHDLARAKLSGYMDHPSSVARRFPASDSSLAARYARTIVEMRTGNIRSALQSVDALIAAQSDNPYFWELKGEMLIRAGQPAQAIEPLRRAVSLRPDAPLIRATLGQALVGTESPTHLEAAIRELSTALDREPDFAAGFRYLAQAYGRAGRVPEAELATAQGHLAAGDYEAAKRFAQRAKQGLPSGTPAWRRADDILNYRPPGT
jgi:predicted Zn-dependent protease